MAEEKLTTRRASSTSQQDKQAQSLEQQAEQGYFGALPDPTPNDNYTVAGVTAGKPTPETDADLRRQAREAVGLL